MVAIVSKEHIRDLVRGNQTSTVVDYVIIASRTLNDPDSMNHAGSLPKSTLLFQVSESKF